MQYFLFLAVVVALVSPAIAETDLAHTTVEFHFTVDLPYSDAAPLFGAWAEQKWAPEFKPEFLYPVPPADQEGAVFRVQKGKDSSIWVNTLFDLPSGRVQYVYVLGAVLVTRIDIHLKKSGDHKTDVAVTYERTALDASGNEKVKSMANADAGSANEWRDAIDAYGASMKPRR